MPRPVPFFPAATTLALAAASASAQAMPPLAPIPLAAEGTLLTVSAQGRSHRVPDVATVRAGVMTQASTAAAALAADAAAMDRALAALRAAGVAPRDVATAAVSLQPQQRYEDGRPPAIIGYQAVNTVSVRLRDVAGAGRVLDALVAAGINQIEGPTLSLADPDAALDEARTDAVRRARARADLYARASGLRVERIAALSEEGSDSGSTPSPIMFRRVQAAAAPPTRLLAGEADVTATLRVDFILR